MSTSRDLMAAGASEHTQEQGAVREQVAEAVRLGAQGFLEADEEARIVEHVMETFDRVAERLLAIAAASGDTWRVPFKSGYLSAYEDLKKLLVAEGDSG